MSAFYDFKDFDETKKEDIKPKKAPICHMLNPVIPISSRIPKIVCPKRRPTSQPVKAPMQGEIISEIITRTITFTSTNDCFIKKFLIVYE